MTLINFGQIAPNFKLNLPAQTTAAHSGLSEDYRIMQNILILAYRLCHFKGPRAKVRFGSNTGFVPIGERSADHVRSTPNAPQLSRGSK
jgi:hypothetical protein